VNVPLGGCILSFDYEFKNNTRLGHYIQVNFSQISLDSFDNNNAAYKFKLYQNYELYSYLNYTLINHKEPSVSQHQFDIYFGDDFYENYVQGQDNWYFGLEIRNN